MRALIQRVSGASVAVDGKVIGEIGHGMLILICAMEGDDATKGTALAAKISKLRIFKDEIGRASCRERVYKLV